MQTGCPINSHKLNEIILKTTSCFFFFFQVASPVSISEEWQDKKKVWKWPGTWPRWLVSSALYRLVRFGVYHAALPWWPVLLSKRGEASSAGPPVPVVQGIASKWTYSPGAEKRENYMKKNTHRMKIRFVSWCGCISHYISLIYWPVEDPHCLPCIIIFYQFNLLGWVNLRCLILIWERFSWL